MHTYFNKDTAMLTNWTKPRDRRDSPPRTLHHQLDVPGVSAEGVGGVAGVGGRV